MGTIIIKYLYKFMGTIVLLFYVILSEKGETPYVKSRFKHLNSLQKPISRINTGIVGFSKGQKCCM